MTRTVADIMATRLITLTPDISSVRLTCDSCSVTY